MTDCLNEINSFAGFDADHNGKCPRAASDPNVHLTTTTHHVRIGGTCMNVCANCAAHYSKRRDAIVKELEPETTAGYPSNPGPAGGAYAKYIKRENKSAKDITSTQLEFRV